PVQTREALEELVDGLKDFLARERKNVLVVEHDPARRARLLELLDGPDCRVTAAATGKEALQAIGEQHVDCLVLGPDLPDMTVAAAFAEAAAREPAPGGRLPVVVYADGDLSGEAETGMKRLAQACTVRPVYSPERLLDQTALFLHRNVAELP